MLGKDNGLDVIVYDHHLPLVCPRCVILNQGVTQRIPFSSCLGLGSIGLACAHKDLDKRWLELALWVRWLM